MLLYTIGATKFKGESCVRAACCVLRENERTLTDYFTQHARREKSSATVLQPLKYSS